MNREELERGLLSLKDLTQRWGYSSVNGVRKRLRFDPKAPQPIKLLNNRIAIYWLPDIEHYENLRGDINASKSRYAFYGTKEEWNAKSRKEREQQRGFPYDEQEWREAEKR